MTRALDPYRPFTLSTCAATSAGVGAVACQQTSELPGPKPWECGQVTCTSSAALPTNQPTAAPEDGRPPGALVLTKLVEWYRFEVGLKKNVIFVIFRGVCCVRLGSTEPALIGNFTPTSRRSAKCAKIRPSPNRLYSTSFVKTNAPGGFPSSGTAVLTDFLKKK